VAYIEAAFISVVAGVTTALRDDHAHYFRSSIQVLKADNWAMFIAAGQAQ
jgi:antirestriction protein ArdC